MRITAGLYFISIPDVFMCLYLIFIGSLECDAMCFDHIHPFSSLSLTKGSYVVIIMKI